MCCTSGPATKTCWSQQLEVTVGALLPDQPALLLRRRLEFSREEVLKLWTSKHKLDHQL
jgi:hypothetical protein